MINTYNNIQSLRAIAALLVVAHHSMQYFFVMNLSNPVYEFIGKFGYLGVDVFFVISGFVIAKTTANKASGFENSINFIAKRFARIYLGYWPLFLLAVAYYAYFNPVYLQAKEILQSFLLVNANMFDLVISPAWSLTYELYFYLIIAFLLLSTKLKYQVVFFVLTSLIILKGIFIDFGESKFIDFFLSPLVLEFMSGYILFKYINALSNKKHLLYVAVLTFSIFLLSIFYNIGYGYVRVFTFGVFAFSLVWLFVILETNNIWISKGLLIKIGNASYTLYLSHTVLLGIFRTHGLTNYLESSHYPLFGFFLYLIFIIFVSLLFYKLVELPLYKLVSKKLKL